MQLIYINKTMKNSIKTGLVVTTAVTLSLVGFGQAFGYGGGSITPFLRANAPAPVSVNANPGTTTPTQAVLGEKVPSVATALIATVKAGTKSDQVVQLQNELKALGYFPKNVASTGFYGPITVAAVKKYQADQEKGQVLGVKVDASNALLKELIAGTKQNTRTDKVFQLQTELKKAGFYPSGYAVSGFYGTITKASVEKYLASQR